MRQHAAHVRARGVAMLELAIILPILLMLSMGALEFSLAISEYKALTVQARVAARYLSARAPGDAQAQGEAICLVKYGVASAKACSGTLILPGLAKATVTVLDAASSVAQRAQATDASTDKVSVNLVTVTISGYNYQPLAGSFLTSLAGQSAITFDPISATMRQAL